jgi:putative addiction module CopG family antidote
LPEDVARFAEAKVSSGRFASVEDVLRAGVEALEAQEEREQDWLAYAREKWDEGIASSQRDGSIRMSAGEFSAFLDECVHDAER